MSTTKQANASKSLADAGPFSMNIKGSLAVTVGEDHEPELVYGTNHSDVINTGGGPQHIIADNGSDYVSAGGGPDIIEGNNGQDSLIGGGGPDRMTGGNGNDVLTGGPGPDNLSGGNGDDILTGGIGADMLVGGRGADTFMYLDSSDAPAHGEEDEGGEGVEGGHEDEGGGLKVETIADFKAGIDKIDFTAFDNLVAFFSDVPTANAIWVEQVGEDTVLKVDLMNGIEGDHPAEMSIVLLGVNAGDLSAVDFLF